MKFHANSDEMGKSIQGLAKMVSGKSSLPILDHFLFEVDDDNLHVTASDGENMMKTTMNIEVQSIPDDENDRRFCIHNTIICDFLKNIPSQPITFDVDRDNDVVMVSYMNGHIQFPCAAGEEYPAINILNGEHKTATADWTRPGKSKRIMSHKPTHNTIMRKTCTISTPYSPKGTMATRCSHRTHSSTTLADLTLLRQSKNMRLSSFSMIISPCATNCRWNLASTEIV